MPLSCLTQDGSRLQAFDLSADNWEELRVRNTRDRHLRMPCCSAEVVLKRSNRGTQFFSHKRIGSCATADESEEHRQLKLIAVAAARSAGWTAETEVAGTSPSGEQWRADILATRGKTKVAIEVQWSGQPDQEMLRRQRLYERSDVRGLWLVRRPALLNMHALPAACIGGTLKDGFTALLFHTGLRVTAASRTDQTQWRQAVPMFDFLQAGFERRLKWGLAIDVFGPQAELSIILSEASCWTSGCGVLSPIVEEIRISNPGMNLTFSLPEIGDHPAIARHVLAHLPSSNSWDHIKHRYSRPQHRRYLSNGCSTCDALFGEYMLLAEPDARRVIIRLPIELQGVWRSIASEHPSTAVEEPQWWVLPKE